MKKEIKEYFDELYNLLTNKQEPLIKRYKKLRDVLERVLRLKMMNTSLQTTDLGARINYVASMCEMTRKEQNALHTFRLTSNDILNDRKLPIEDDFERDISSVAYAFRKIFGVDIGYNLYRLLPKTKNEETTLFERREFIPYMRVCFDYLDDDYLYVTSIDSVEDEFIKVAYNVKGANEEFNETIDLLWRFAQLNLLDVSVDANGVYIPYFIVLEPDYLIDISSLAECYRDYGSNHLNYILSRLVPVDNARALLLGNIANLFLDEWIHAGDEEPDFMLSMKKAFRQYPIELAACEELKDPAKTREFVDDCKKHFNNIKQTVEKTFNEAGYKLDKSDAVLEPSYICEPLGIQGRLDYMQRDMTSFIEMKSGKADEYLIKGKIEPKENNRVQMLLYAAVLRYSMGQDRNKIKPYLLYTRYPLLYPARPSWANVKRIINLRNQIVNCDYGVQLRNSIDYTEELLQSVTPYTLNEKGLRGRFWDQYLYPSIARFTDELNALTTLEKKYFYTLYNFITKELYTSKSGDVEHEGRCGAAALWRSTIEEKKDAGEILYDLKIKQNNAADAHKAFVILSIPQYGEMFLPNFRNGDAVVLYQRNTNNDNVTNKLVFKGNIEIITDKEIRLRLRAPQRNLNLFPIESCYAMEHDVMDTTFRSMYLGLSQFMRALPDRRQLILGQRKPESDRCFDERISKATDDFDRVALKAEAAKDYFLLVGPPGTGKTSRALRTMVERFYAQDKQLLLMAYTNRAVDEICQSVSSILPSIDYIRVGSELSCDSRFHDHLLENKLASCNNRADVNRMMSECRVYIGTVASISSKTELFKLKRFDATIIDEATQILEPQLLGILSARSSDGKNAIGKFILIGDYKQLPAVILQSSESSEIRDEELQGIGLYNLKDSLFERLHRNALKYKDNECIDMLCRQGRMNPDVADFPNREFYEGRLLPVGLPHQIERLQSPVRFIPSQRDIENSSGKTNIYEARIVAQAALEIYNECKEEFDYTHTLGVITPYRSQIALIRKELLSLNIPDLANISVDTVERYQGSERDVIIYSFCVNYRYQLNFLPNIIEENGKQIDRKLNVALTRARKRIIITGVEEILKLNPIYRRLIEDINQ